MYKEWYRTRPNRPKPPPAFPPVAWPGYTSPGKYWKASLKAQTRAQSKAYALACTTLATRSAAKPWHGCKPIPQRQQIADDQNHNAATYNSPRPAQTVRQSHTPADRRADPSRRAAVVPRSGQDRDSPTLSGKVRRRVAANGPLRGSRARAKRKRRALGNSAVSAVVCGSIAGVERRNNTAIPAFNARRLSARITFPAAPLQSCSAGCAGAARNESLPRLAQAQTPRSALLSQAPANAATPPAICTALAHRLALNAPTNNWQARQAAPILGPVIGIAVIPLWILAVVVLGFHALLPTKGGRK